MQVTLCVCVCVQVVEQDHAFAHHESQSHRNQSIENVLHVHLETSHREETPLGHGHDQGIAPVDAVDPSVCDEAQDFLYESLVLKDMVSKLYGYRKKVVRIQRWARGFLACRNARLFALSLYVTKIRDILKHELREKRRRQEVSDRDKP